MTNKKETKHEAFLRLMQRRLGRALEELRLVQQLSSTNYENTPEEAEEVIAHLDGAVRKIAEVFDVEYATRIGKGSSQTTANARPIGAIGKKVSIVDEIAIAHMLDMLQKGLLTELHDTLRGALTRKAA